MAEMLIGAGIALISFVAGLWAGNLGPSKQESQEDLLDPYEDYRNEKGLLSMKAVRKSK